MSPKIMFTAALASTLALSCNQSRKTPGEDADQQQGAARAATPQEQKPDESTQQKAADAKPLKAGASLTYLPKTCEVSRLYFNARTLKKYGATAAELAPMLGNAMTTVPEARKTMGAALKGLHANGIDLASDVHELAGCVKAEDAWIGVLTVDLGDVKGKPLELMKKAAAEELDVDLKLKKKGDVSYLVADEAPGALAVIDQRALAYASSPEVLVTAKKRPGNRQAFGADFGKTVLASRFDGGPIENGSLDISQDGDSTVAQLRITLHADDIKRIKQDRAAYIGALDKWAHEQGFDVSDDSLKKIAQMPEKASFSMKGNEVSAKVVMANDDLAGLLVALAGMTPDDLVETLPKL